MAMPSLSAAGIVAGNQRQSPYVSPEEVVDRALDGIGWPDADRGDLLTTYLDNTATESAGRYIEALDGVMDSLVAGINRRGNLARAAASYGLTAVLAQERQNRLDGINDVYTSTVKSHRWGPLRLLPVLYRNGPVTMITHEQGWAGTVIWPQELLNAERPIIGGLVSQALNSLDGSRISFDGFHSVLTAIVPDQILQEQRFLRQSVGLEEPTP